MNEKTQLEFESLIEEYYHRQKKALKLTAPNFNHCGFLSKAVMSGSGGSVEILYGPTEYHAEVFISLHKEKKRWALADLMSFNTVSEWLLNYSKNANPTDKTDLEADIEWIFLILVDGLNGIPNFEWITSEDAQI